MAETTTDLRPDHVRVFATAGVGTLVAGRWGDVPVTEGRLEGWRAAGLVRDVDYRGQPAPDRLRRCCGDRR